MSLGGPTTSSSQFSNERRPLPVHHTQARVFATEVVIRYSPNSFYRPNHSQLEGHVLRRSRHDLSLLYRRQHPSRRTPNVFTPSASLLMFVHRCQLQSAPKMFVHAARSSSAPDKAKTANVLSRPAASMRTPSGEAGWKQMWWMWHLWNIG